LRTTRVLLGLLAVLGGLGGSACRSGSSEGETLGFVVSAWDHGFPHAARPNCPGGTNRSEAQHFNVHVKSFRADVKTLGWAAANEKHFPPDACRDPHAQPDPGFQTLELEGPVDGLDLDGKDSKKTDRDQCAHDDFVGYGGTRGIDNQHWRLVGCIVGFQPFFAEIREGRVGRQRQGGMWIAEEDNPILVEISGVNDRRNDPEISVRFFSSAEPIALDANGEVVTYLSLGVHPDDRYWSAPARGRIEDGVVSTEPIDLKLRFKQQVFDGERWFRDARLRARFNEAGRLDGVLGFYWDTENFFRIHNDHQIDGNHTGRLLALARLYMCAGMYHALGRLADGHPDPATGRCTSISSALRFQATPAFVITDPR
jgi:hypothetical protein